MTEWEDFITKCPVCNDNKIIKWAHCKGFGLWVLGIGVWCLGIAPNPQSPIPNPQSPFHLILIILYYY